MMDWRVVEEQIALNMFTKQNQAVSGNVFVCSNLTKKKKRKKPVDVFDHCKKGKIVYFALGPVQIKRSVN